MAGRGYNLTDDIAAVVHLLALRVPRLAHVVPGQIVHGVVQARNRSRYGVYAQCHGLRFRHGKREQINRDGTAWVWPDIRVGGRQVLYYISYFMPRFMDQPPRQRLHTLLHELYHISPKFNGDLRRFAGRNEFHGNSRAEFDGVVDDLLEEALGHLDAERFPFLRSGFDELTQRFGAVVGTRLKNFAPKRVPATELPSILAIEPPAMPAPRPAAPAPVPAQPASAQPAPAAGYPGTAQRRLF